MLSCWFLKVFIILKNVKQRNQHKISDFWTPLFVNMWSMVKSLHGPEQIVSEQWGPVVRTDGFRLEGSSMHGVEGCGVLDDNERKILTGTKQNTDYELSLN